MVTNREKAVRKGRTSARRILVVFSIILFLFIFIVGSIAFFLSMYNITRTSAGHELAQVVEIERIKLSASVNAEIAIAMKMAGSPLIQRYFMNPGDPDLERIALEEIAGYRRAFAGNTVFWVNNIDKKFYSDDAYIYTIDTSDPDNYWYLNTLNETEVYNFNINYNPNLDVINLWINAPVFDANRRPIGILGTGIDLTAFIDAIYKDYSENGELYFFNTLNEITGARNASLVTNKVTLDKEFGETGNAIIDRAKNLRPNAIEYFSEGGNEIAIGGVSALDWYIAVVLPISVSDTLDSGMTILFFTIMAGIAIIFIIFYFFVTHLIKPMNIMMKTLGQVSDDWDLTRRLNIQRNDETGALADYINLTFEKFSVLIKNIKKEMAGLSNIGNDLATDMNETASAMNEITSNVQSIKTRILNQSASVTQTNATMEQITFNLHELNEHVEDQSNNITQASSAIEEMVANIQSVTQTLIKNSANVKELTDATDVGRAGLQDVASDIQEIARESEGLLEINSVMENIASQTNLLSMNAAIEAAHAGEAGKGFAVVADEIRKLAESSSEQSKTIGNVLKKIKGAIDKITVSTENVLNKFEAIDSNIKTVVEQEELIRNAMEEQGEGSKQLLLGVTNVNEITLKVKTGSEEML
ncbi:MAG: methyl-accepting chemotaxis protein, partial [Treponema sp.]|nr:methyl-accepting chemotaxis protein [Treponema sp.]